MSSSDDEDQDEINDDSMVRDSMVLKELTREEKSLLGRRFEPYFDKMRISADEYFRRGRQPFDRAEWIKLTFDGETKRVHKRPKNIEELFEIAKKRFGVLRKILDTEQFKPIASFQHEKIASHVQIESQADMNEFYALKNSEKDTVSIRFTVLRSG